MNDRELLHKFIAGHDEQAFAELVRRHIDMVYSAARRQLKDPAAIEDVTQSVFVMLAKKAQTIRDSEALAGWLLVTTRFVAINMIRAEIRRHRHELEAAAMKTQSPNSTDFDSISPMLDEAIATLKREDRDAITLRYFKGQNLFEIAASLGVSEQAAQKRLSRAVQKLRDFFARRGVEATSEGLASLLAGQVIASAPQQLSASVTAHALSSLSGTKSAAVLVATAKTKVVSVSIVAFLLAAISVPVVYQVVQNQRQTKTAPANDWKPRFDQVYSLSQNQNVKFVRSPFIAQRQQMIDSLETPGRPPGQEIFASIICDFTDEPQFTFGTYEKPTLAELLQRITGIWPQDTLIDPSMMKKQYQGDWIVREKATRLEKINGFLTAAVDANATLKSFDDQRSVVVVRGKLDAARLKSGKDPFATVHFYRGDINKEWDSSTIAQNSGEMLQMLGETIGRPVIVEADLSGNDSMQIMLHKTADFSKDENPPDDATVDQVLDGVALQTGLEFSRESRKVATWHLMEVQPWEKRFDEVYGLEPNQIVKNVLPPFIPERQGFYKTWFSAEQVRDLPQGFDEYVLTFNGSDLSWNHADEPGNVMELLMDLPHIWPQDVEMPRELLLKPVKGDWVVRQSATDEQIADALAPMLSQIAGTQAFLKAEQVEREVIVVRGEYKFTPLPETASFGSPNSIYFFRGQPEKKGLSGTGQMLDWLGAMTQMPVVVEASGLPYKFGSSWCANKSADFHKSLQPPDGAAIDEILANVSKQTSLKFTREKKTVKVWKLVTAQQ